MRLCFIRFVHNRQDLHVNANASVKFYVYVYVAKPVYSVLLQVFNPPQTDLGPRFVWFECVVTYVCLRLRC